MVKTKTAPKRKKEAITYVGRARTFRLPDKPHQKLENHMATAQYHEKAALIAALARDSVDRPLGKVLTDIRRSLGVVVHTKHGYTTTPTLNEVSRDIQKRLRRAKSSLRNGMGNRDYSKRNSKQLKTDATKDELLKHRRMILALEDLDAAITKAFAKYKVA